MIHQTTHRDPSPMSDRRHRPPLSAGWFVAAAAIATVLLAWSEVTLLDLARHPVWSLRQIVLSGVQAMGGIVLAALQALVLVVPVWLFVRWREGRASRI